MKDSRKIVEQVLNNQVPDRIPASFWSHFVSFHDHHRGLEDKQVLQAVYEGQKAYIDNFSPDLLKIMSDGFFGHPGMTKELINDMDDLAKLESCGPNHPWITEQVKYVKEIAEYAGEDIYKYYTVFSPLQYIRLKFEEFDEDFEKFTRIFFSNPDKMVEVASRIAEDIIVLVDKLFKETKIDGIYYSVQSVQSPKADHNFHKKYVEPLDLLILNHINKYAPNAIIHICGYGHYTNNLSWYREYPAAIFNWATHTENCSLAEGKKIFNKPVLGGFDNNSESILYSGSYDELTHHLEKWLGETDLKGIIIGGDCTISSDLTVDQVNKIKQILQGIK